MEDLFAGIANFEVRTMMLWLFLSTDWYLIYRYPRIQVQVAVEVLRVGDKSWTMKMTFHLSVVDFESIDLEVRGSMPGHLKDSVLGS